MMNSKLIRNIYVVAMTLVAIMILVGMVITSGRSGVQIRTEYVRDVAVDTLGMLVCGVFLIGLYAGDKDDKQNRCMFRMIVILSALFFMDLASSCVEGHGEYVSLIMAINTLGFILEDLLGYAYWCYIREELKLGGRFLKIANFAAFLAVVVNVTIELLNIKFKLLFDITPEGEYVYMPFQFATNIAIICVYVLTVLSIARARQEGIKEKLILLSFVVFPLLAYIYSSISLEYTWNLVAYLLSILLIYIRVFSQREKKIAEQQVLLTKQSTALMISQIQPHFLYNVLTTISNLCVTDPEEAEETTVLFSQYLRTNLDSLRTQDTVSFNTELMHIKTYVELEKKRFGDILNVDYDINETNFKVPSLGLQPIVENSIKHGIRGKNDKGHIKIGTYKVDDGVEIIIEDDGVGFDMNGPAKEDGRSHVGMTNVEERLRQMCNATMTVESSVGNGCKTVIFIPEE